MDIKRFLCCFTTREGTFICAIGSLLIAALRIYLQWFNMEFLQRLTETQRSDLPLSMKTLRSLNILDTTVSSIAIFVTLLLLIGACKRKHNLLLPWVVWVILEEVMDVCVLISYATKNVKLNCSVYIGDAVFFLINMYCVLCVYSYFKQLKQESKNSDRQVYNLGSCLDDSDEESLLPSLAGNV